MGALGIANRSGEQTTETIDCSPETIRLRARQKITLFLKTKVYHILFRGTQWDILRKRPKNNKKHESSFPKPFISILGNCWEKCICSSLLAGLMEEFPASKVHLQPAT